MKTRFWIETSVAAGLALALSVWGTESTAPAVIIPPTETVALPVTPAVETPKDDSVSGADLAGRRGIEPFRFANMHTLPATEFAWDEWQAMVRPASSPAEN